MLVRSEKTPIGRVLLRSSTNLLSMALVVRVAHLHFSSEKMKKFRSSYRSSLRLATTRWYFPCHFCAHWAAAARAFTWFLAR